MFIDVVKYFAKFSTLEGVLENFTSGSSRVAGYSDLIAELGKQTYLGIVPRFVFGPTLEKVTTRVTSILDGPYLFIDYGEFEHSTTAPGQFSDFARLAVTVACPLRDSSFDSVEQLLLMEDCLTRLVKIRNEILKLRCNHDPFYRGISKEHSITPFEAPALASAGWTMIFSRSGFDTLSGKPK